MEKRPIIKIELSLIDTVVEVLGFIQLLTIWGFVFYIYQQLPQTIPIHFNLAGEADNFGNKNSIFSLPIVGTIIYIGMTIINKFPQIFNYGAITISKENALEKYTTATRMLRFLKFTIMVVFFIIVLYTVNKAIGKNDGSGDWLLPSSLMIIFVPVIFFIVRLFKK